MDTQTITKWSSEAMARTATISDTTRDYLVIYGKLVDVEDSLCRLIVRDYGEDQVDRMMVKYQSASCIAIQEVLTHIMSAIADRMMSIGETQV